MSRAGTTKRLDRLEAAGLIQRVLDPAGRRSFRVFLRAEGLEVADAALTDLIETLADLSADLNRIRFLSRDRDGRYGEAFDAVFQSEETEILTSAPQAPRMNAHRERVIGSIRREALDHVLIMNGAHARHVLAAYERHYNEYRPHLARNQLPPDVHERDLPLEDLAGLVS
ncbi:hypothetical protein GCM10010246_58890 [Streptomyces cuspidosporus]|uniref:Integrase catalytic domain-containing protein n=2 Tax=Streptomyces cuspidosporus TaxID=66882 RepID=A0ABN3GTQ3_9ACTN